MTAGYQKLQGRGCAGEEEEFAQVAQVRGVDCIRQASGSQKRQQGIRGDNSVALFQAANAQPATHLQYNGGNAF